ncbi:hypothetical protein [Paracoccus sp. IB05]|uniref:hypothetical protein n=1 Tax=Paracoccus sp. IB05 TaxID=2779367 RepID=UPI0018E8E629|nr:hypothetical protein [Paracoccus sp. IB05]MBJ2153871.1 hypothetical protein [Paracoccus sp. IB05]
MTTENPTQPEVLAAVIGLVMHMRRTIEMTDRADLDQVATTLGAIHEHLAVIGGSVAMLAEELGHRQEVENRVRGNLEKAKAFASCTGLEGRA